MPVLTSGDPAEGIELIPENDQVNVMLTKVEENNFVYNDEEIEKLKWYFTVMDDGPWKGKDIIGDTSQKFVAHPECKAYNWATVISGRNFPGGTQLDTDELLMMRCRILIGHKTSKGGRVFMNVKEVMPPRSDGTTIAAPDMTLDVERDGTAF